MIELKEVSCSFSDGFGGKGLFTAVSPLSAHFSDGGRYAIVGESGSGKSVTSLSVMGLLAEPGHVAGGEMTFDGKDLVHLSEKEYREMRGNDMAMIFQEPMTSLNPVYRIGDQIVEVRAELLGIADFCRDGGGGVAVSSHLHGKAASFQRERGDLFIAEQVEDI